MNFDPFQNHHSSALLSDTYIAIPGGFAPRRQGKVRCLFYTSALAALIGLAACASDSKNDAIPQDMRTEGQRLFGGAQPSGGTAQADAPDSATGAKGSRATPKPAKSKRVAGGDASGWVIVLDFLSGPTHERAAAQRRIGLVGELGRDDIAIRSRSGGSAVVMGSYASADDPRAQQDLEWVRSVSNGRTQPFSRAYLLPPTNEGAASGKNEEWNLAGIRERREGSGMDLTLQVAVFAGDGDLARARAEAEAFAVELRRAGERAYFFHGASLSVVTVGLFTNSEADGSGAPASRAAREAQRAHPLNLKDGQDPIPDRAGVPQSSALMRIP